MKIIKLKISLHRKCVEKQQDVVDNALSSMDEAQKAANEYGPPKDRYDSFRTQLLRKRDMYAEQYEKALKDLDYLQKINPELSNSRVNINTLVITDKQPFYITIGLGKIEMDGTTYFVISPVAPIYQALKDKKAGDTVIFNGQKITIKEVR